MCPGSRHFPAIATLSFAAVLGACASSSGEGDAGGAQAFADPIGDTAVTVEEQGTPGDVSSGDALRFGLVEIAQPTSDGLNSGYAAATFVSFAEPRSYENLIAERLPPLDGCKVVRTATSNGEDIFDDGGDRRIGAGETLTFRSPAGTWLTLDRDASFAIEYINERELEIPLPSGLVLDIPGDEFPAFPNVNVRDVSPVDIASDVGGAPNGTLRWNVPATAEESVLVRIRLLGVDEAGTVTDVDCLAADDGEFALPANVLSSLPEDALANPTLSRFGVTALRQGDALLMVTVESPVD